jgi:hypothetical protein
MNNEQMPSATPQQRSRAVRAAAHHALDAEELALWLDMLGLDADEGQNPVTPAPRDGDDQRTQHRLHDPRKRQTKIT